MFEALAELGVHQAIDDGVVAAVGTAQEQGDHVRHSGHRGVGEHRHEHGDAEGQPGADEDKDDDEEGRGQTQLFLPLPLLLLPPLLLLGSRELVRMGV